MAVAQPVILFLEACVLGVLLGVLYDVFRILRLALPHGKIIVFVEDILYFFLITVISFAFVLLWADGVVRSFLLLGELLGGVVYFFTLSLLILKAAGLIIRAVKAVLHFLFRVTLLPVWRLIRRIGHGCRKLWDFLASRYKIIHLKRKKHLKPAGGVVYNDNN